eukprot:3306435-Rhodomonas_salina.3
MWHGEAERLGPRTCHFQSRVSSCESASESLRLQSTEWDANSERRPFVMDARLGCLRESEKAPDLDSDVL